MSVKLRWVWCTPVLLAGALIAMAALDPGGSAPAIRAGAAPGSSPSASAPGAAAAVGAQSAAAGSGAAGAVGASRKVTFAGRKFEVPANWPVINLQTDPSTCVRFDVHAVYIGNPGANEQCPARGAGRPQGAVLITSSSFFTPAQATDNPTAHVMKAAAPGIAVEASYGSDRSVVLGILDSANLIPSGRPSQSSTPPAGPATSIPTAPGTLHAPNLPTAPSPTATPAALSEATATATPATTGPAATATPPATDPADRSATGRTSVKAGTNTAPSTLGAGLGFDTCAAPSTSTMQAWGASPYSNVGIYIGGSDRACAQPNLTASWVTQETAAGWSFMPFYVGPQAAFGEITSPQTQAVQCADDAATQAQALGIKPGAIIYYDMEAYPTTASATATAFMSAWTKELHAKGYFSGIYGSLNSGISDLVANWGSASDPDYIDIADWNSTADADPAAAPATEWAGRRVHQFAGGTQTTYGGIQIDIDQDFSGLVAAQCDIGVTPVSPSPTKTRSGTPGQVGGCVTGVGR